MKILVLKFPINGDKTEIEFDEEKYKADNKCNLIDKLISFQDGFIILTYQVLKNKMSSTAGR